jgi:ABC-type sugar transport system substrate-binding protein
MTLCIDWLVQLECEGSNTTAAAVAATTEAVAGLPATQMVNALVCSWTPTAAGTYSIAVQLAQSAAAQQQPVNAVCGDADMNLCDGVASVVVYAGASSLPHVQVTSHTLVH